ncbi:MAG TPA: hypothetical protein VF425_09790 [Thermoanaerobaculia bacterium]
MTDVVSFDPKSRYGKTADRWGNLLLPVGAAHVDTRFAFEGEGKTTFRVSRVNAFPQDPGKRLYYYLRTEGNPNNS